MNENDLHIHHLVAQHLERAGRALKATFPPAMRKFLVRSYIGRRQRHFLCWHLRRRARNPEKKPELNSVQRR